MNNTEEISEYTKEHHAAHVVFPVNYVFRNIYTTVQNVCTVMYSAVVLLDIFRFQDDFTGIILGYIISL